MNITKNFCTYTNKTIITNNWIFSSWLFMSNLNTWINSQTYSNVYKLVYYYTRNAISINTNHIRKEIFESFHI